MVGKKKVKLVKALVAKSDNLTSVPGTHVVEGENQFLPAIF